MSSQFDDVLLSACRFFLADSCYFFLLSVLTVYFKNSLIRTQKYDRSFAVWVRLGLEGSLCGSQWLVVGLAVLPMMAVSIP